MPSNAVTRWDPFAEMATLRTLMDRVFDQPFRFPAIRPGSEEFGAGSLGLDVIETNENLVVKAAVPGVDPDKVDIQVNDDVLTIKGSFETSTESGDEHYHRRELRSGSFERSLRLPPTVDAGKAQAQFENGLLTLTLPKKPEAQTRSIKITPQGVIDAPKAE